MNSIDLMKTTGESWYLEERYSEKTRQCDGDANYRISLLLKDFTRNSLFLKDLA